MKYLKGKLGMIFITLIVIGGSFFAGVYFGYNDRPEVEKVTDILNKKYTGEFTGGEVDFEPFWKAWNTINEKYVASTSTLPTNQEKVWGAISGLARSLGDPYTTFLPPVEAEIFESDISGNFEGVGMEIGIREEELTVIAPLKDTPAERAGIKAADKILKIDGVPSLSMSIDKAITLIRGERGTAVVLTIGREETGEVLDIEIIRDIIDIPVIETELRDDGVFVIGLYSFTGTAPRLFKNALEEFSNSHSDKLILDLRGNPGGFLEVAVDMASWFLPAGKVVVTEDFGSDKDDRVYRSRGYDIFSDELKLVILINEGSASASEILAGALREHKKAILVGQKTFGKGSVQELVKITPDTSLKVTVARWLTPNGISISEDKLSPDYEVERSLEDFQADRDPQLDKAVEILLNYDPSILDNN